MIDTDRVDSIVFDLKQSIEDFSNELKIVMEELNELNKKVNKLEEKTLK